MLIFPPSRDHGTLSGLTDNDHTNYVLHSILTTKGDIFVRGASAIARVGVGADGQALIADAAEATGVKWGTAGGAGVTVHADLTGLTADDHLQYIRHALATAVNDFLVASGSGAVVKKTLAETKTILGITTGVSCTLTIGTYTGNGAATRTITGTGVDLTSGIWFLQILSQGNGGINSTYQTSSDTGAQTSDTTGGDSGVEYGTSFLAAVGNGTFSITNNSHTGGNSLKLNANGMKYTYIILKAA